MIAQKSQPSHVSKQTCFWALSWLLLWGTACNPAPTLNPVAPVATKMEVAEKVTESLPVASQPAAESPPSNELNASSIEETWDAIFMQGQKIGYSHSRRVIVKNASTGESELISFGEQFVKVNRFGTPLEIQMTFQTTESTDGKMLSLESSSSTGTQALKSIGVVNDGLLQLSVAAMGKKTSATIPWDDSQTKGFFAVEQSLRAQPLKPGETRKVRWFQPVANQITLDQLTALDWEDVMLLEGRRKLLKIRNLSQLDANQKIESFLWIDEQGNILRSVIPGLQQESFRTTKSTAIAPAEKLFDLGRSTVVKANRALLNHTAMAVVEYKVTLKFSDPSLVFPESLSQSVTKLDEHTAKIVVRKVLPHQPEKLAAPIAPPTPADLSPNALIQSDAPAVQKLAAKIASQEKDAWMIALETERFVRENIVVKDFSQAFATAAEVATSLEGDCTEHAVLVAAICRAKGIPARVAAGLVYYDREQAFAYHMWNEVWIHDRWVPIDATLARGGIGGGHLKIFDSNLAGASAFTAFIPVINVLGQLQLEIVQSPE